ncbi:hypothetical protein MLD38_016152 [Melastoma candidum]|uniref:Uncharacterized protein n=1 Tax=Melastoma candidum TaxID=119954 RepID=A0ACB9RRZ1_9MYRT|nr:hypothetical protein MLD38_016152 [Melastoma candidum]
MSRKTPALDKDAPWRATSARPLPRIHHAPILRVNRTDHAIAAMTSSDPIGYGLAIGAVVEAAGPDCIVPGLSPPVTLLGVKVWPIEVNLKFLEPVERELKLLGKFMDSAVSLMNKSFIDQ